MRTLGRPHRGFVRRCLQCKMAGWIPSRGDAVPISLKSLLSCGIAAASAMTFSAAQAADPGFCREYAMAAVRQVELSRSILACNRGVGPRWTSDYRVHFDWCVGAPYATVRAERAARTNWMRSCRGM
jgi:hypothetical protein